MLTVQPEDLDHALSVPTDTRLFAVAYAMLVKELLVERIYQLTKIDRWFLYKLENIVEVYRKLKELGGLENVDAEMMKKSKRMGFF